MKQLPHIAATLYGFPWSILPQSHQELSMLYRSYVRGELTALPAAIAEKGEPSHGISFQVNHAEGIAIVNLSGVISGVPLTPDAEQKKQAIAATPIKKFWVSENTTAGLIVGPFVEVTRTTGSPLIMGASRYGSGGGFKNSGVAPSTTTLEQSFEHMAFIPHTKETRSFASDKEFSARVTPDGTIRLDDSTVVTKYKLLSIEK